MAAVSNAPRAAAGTRQLARSNGAKAYIGKPCPYGHDGERYVSTGQCIECAKSDSARKVASGYFQSHYADNAGRILSRQREYTRSHTQEINARTMAWVKRNPLKRKAISRQYKARRRSQEDAGISGGMLAAWTREQPKTCFYCGAACPDSFHVDHFVPLAKGGAHVLTNLRIACPTCNLRKNAKMPNIWIEEIDRVAANDTAPQSAAA